MAERFIGCLRRDHQNNVIGIVKLGNEFVFDEDPAEVFPGITKGLGCNGQLADLVSAQRIPVRGKCLGEYLHPCTQTRKLRTVIAAEIGICRIQRLQNEIGR